MTGLAPTVLSPIVMNTYFDSAENVTLTPVQAAKLCQKHGADLEDYLIEIGGEREEYDAQDILLFLGY